MKMNYKMFKNINLEPVEVQEFENKKVEIYNLEETPYFTQYAMRGRFSVWTGDGNGNYKVLIEKGYRENSGKFYDKEINQVWVDFFDKVDKENKKGFRFVMLPAIFVLLVAFILTMAIKSLATYQSQILMFSFIALLIVTIINSRFTRKKFEALSDEAQKEIRKILGEEEINKIVDSQQKYMESYFENLSKEFEEENVALENEEEKLLENDEKIIEDNNEEDVIEYDEKEEIVIEENKEEK